MIFIIGYAFSAYKLYNNKNKTILIITIRTVHQNKKTTLKYKLHDLIVQKKKMHTKEKSQVLLVYIMLIL